MNRYQLTAENIKEVTTSELAKMYYPAKQDKAFSLGCLNNALRMDISDRKLENAKKSYQQIKDIVKMISDELVSRGVKTVSKNGEYC